MDICVARSLEGLAAIDTKANASEYFGLALHSTGTWRDRKRAAGVSVRGPPGLGLGIKFTGEIHSREGAAA